MAFPYKILYNIYNAKWNTQTNYCRRRRPREGTAKENADGRSEKEKGARGQKGSGQANSGSSRANSGSKRDLGRWSPLTPSPHTPSPAPHYTPPASSPTASPTPSPHTPSPPSSSSSSLISNQKIEPYSKLNHKLNSQNNDIHHQPNPIPDESLARRRRNSDNRHSSPQQGMSWSL